MVILAMALISLPAHAQELLDEDLFPTAPARPSLTVIPEGRTVVEYATNGVQLPGFPHDAIGKLVLGAAFVKEFSTNTQLLGQYQTQIWRYADLPVFNVALNILTVQAAQRFELGSFLMMDFVSPFLGGQAIYKAPMSVEGVSRLDFNVLAGVTAVKMFGRDKVLVAGYQFSNLLADVPQTAYSAHTVNLLFRAAIWPERINLMLNYLLQLRLPWDRGVEKNLRNSVGVGFQFMPVAGLVIGVGGDYTYQYAVPLRARIDYYTFNVSIGTDMFLSLP